MTAKAKHVSINPVPLKSARRAALAGLTVTLFMIGTALAESIAHAPAADVGLSSAGLESLTDTIQGYVDREELAGAVALVARRGQVAYLESFGFRDREQGAALKDDDIFRIASQTKALVSVAVMMLQERGKLVIADPLYKYLPEFRTTTVAVPKESGGYDVVPASRPITLRDLLTHHSGIGYGVGPAADRWQKAGIVGWYFADREEPIRETVAKMASLPFDAQPGERLVYGYSTDILGVVVEEVSGMSLDAFLRSQILEPLEMNDTHFYLPKEKADRLTVVYSAQEGGGIERASDAGQGAYLSGPRKSFSGGAGLLSTAGDYGRFLQMLLNGGELDGARILSRKSVELMTTSHYPWTGALFAGDGRGFGLGFWVVEDVGARGVPGSVGEYGWGGAYHSTYWVDPAEELIVVYITQLLPALGLDDQAYVRAMVYGAIVD
ncbi:MAG: serine hydrolase domain-containing protein [Pseudomonadota bacterium]